MKLAARGRSLTVLVFLVSGALALLSSTQTWFSVVRADGGADVLVTGSDASALLSPLSLAVLALGAVLALVGRFLRYVFAVAALGIGVFLAVTTVPLLLDPPISAWEKKVTEVTGLAGLEAVASVVSGVLVTGWPVLVLVSSGLLVLGALFALVTAGRWRQGGERFRAAGGNAADHGGPIDAVDSWDDLSRGTDPTR